MTDAFFEPFEAGLSRSLSLSHKRLSMHMSVVAVSAILLLLFRLFSFIFYCETTAWDSVATLWNNGLQQNKLNAYLYKVHAVTKKSGGVCTILMMKFTSRGLYAVLRARVKSEVYFGLNNP